MPTLDLSRNPNLGDSIITDNRMVVRRNIENVVKTIHPSQWPSINTFRIEIEGLSEAKKDEIIQFLRDNIGQEITLIDYNGVEWTGVVVEDPVTQQMGPDVKTGTLDGDGNPIYAPGCSFKLVMALEGTFDLPPVS
jgi:hypothetical protein